jgi:rhomboid domain-containing protein 1
MHEFQGGQWSRLLVSPFVHGYESHLFFNMTSLLWMGSELETSMGSAKFASMVATLLGLSQGITLLMCKGLLLLGGGTQYYVHHSVGFSGVLFGMKIVLTAWPNDIVPIGLVMPVRYTTWAELFLAQVMVPRSSFIGHLGGILAGYAYLGLNRLFGGAELPAVRFTPRGTSRRANVARRHAAAEPPPGMWRCRSTCDHDNTLATDVCDMCSAPRPANSPRHVPPLR